MSHTVTIAQGAPYSLDSYGNGLAYELKCEGEESVFVQGDDATTFREEYEALERMFPNAPTSIVLRELYAMYTVP